MSLALLQVGRQPRFRPLIALLTVAVAMLAFTAGTQERATKAYADRAVVDVGAPRVVGVDALSRSQLLSAVRAVDPEGRYAMAAVTTSQLDAAGRDEVLAAQETINTEWGTTVVVVTHDGEVGARLGRAVTIRDGRVGAEGRGGRDFAVVAGDGTVQLPPETLADFPPGTLFAVEHTDRTVTLRVEDRGVERPG